MCLIPVNAARPLILCQSLRLCWLIQSNLKLIVPGRGQGCFEYSLYFLFMGHYVDVCEFNGQF